MDEAIVIGYKNWWNLACVMTFRHPVRAPGL